MRYRLRTLLLAAALWPLGVWLAWSEVRARETGIHVVQNGNELPRPAFRTTFTMRDALGLETITVLLFLPVVAAILDYQKSDAD